MKTLTQFLKADINEEIEVKSQLIAGTKILKKELARVLGTNYDIEVSTYLYVPDYEVITVNFHNKTAPKPSTQTWGSSDTILDPIMMKLSPPSEKQKREQWEWSFQSPSKRSYAVGIAFRRIWANSMDEAINKIISWVVKNKPRIEKIVSYWNKNDKWKELEN